MAFGHRALIAASVLCIAAQRADADVAVGEEETPKPAYSATRPGEGWLAILPPIGALEPGEGSLTIDSLAWLREGARDATSDLLFAGFPNLLVDSAEGAPVDVEASEQVSASTPGIPRPVTLAVVGAGLVGLGVLVLRPGR
jgi:hypothetical protein